MNYFVTGKCGHQGNGINPPLSSDSLVCCRSPFGSIKLVVLAKGLWGPSLSAHSAWVNGQDGGWRLPCMQMISVLPLSSSLLAAVSGICSRGWVARTVWMPRELECISEPLHPLPVGLWDPPHSGRQSLHNVDCARRWGRPAYWTLVFLLGVLSVVVVLQSQLDAGRYLLLGALPSLWGLGESPQPVISIVWVETITLSAYQALGKRQRQKRVWITPSLHPVNSQFSGSWWPCVRGYGCPMTLGASPLLPLPHPWRKGSPRPPVPSCGERGHRFLFPTLPLQSLLSPGTHLKSVEGLRSKGSVGMFEQRHLSYRHRSAKQKSFLSSFNPTEQKLRDRVQIESEVGEWGSLAGALKGSGGPS